MIYPDEFWWKDVTGPQAFIRQIVDALCEGFSPVLELPVELPWRHCMRRAFLEKLQDLSPFGIPLFETIDAADECAGRDIGDFLLERFAPSDVASAYRARAGVSVQQYMKKNDVLKGKLLWIKGIPPQDISRWCSFCRGFASPSLEEGSFVLECIGRAPAVASPLKLLRLEDTVSRYDVQLFSSFQLSSQESSLPKRWHAYAAASASRLCGLDAELCEDLLQSEGWRTKDPIALFRESCEARRRAGAGASNREELVQRLWEAQIEILFPHIERLRLRIVEEFRDELASVLERCPQYQFGERVHQPEELEIGTIAYLMIHRAPAPPYDYYIYIPDERMRDLIKVLRECRNRLAHRQCCTPEQVELILTSSL